MVLLAEVQWCIKALMEIECEGVVEAKSGKRVRAREREREGDLHKVRTTERIMN